MPLCQGFDRYRQSREMLERYGPEDEERAHDGGRAAGSGYCGCGGPYGRARADHVIDERDPPAAHPLLELRRHAVLGSEQPGGRAGGGGRGEVEVNVQLRGECLRKEGATDERAAYPRDIVGPEPGRQRANERGDVVRAYGQCVEGEPEVCVIAGFEKEVTLTRR